MGVWEYDELLQRAAFVGDDTRAWGGERRDSAKALVLRIPHGCGRERPEGRRRAQQVVLDNHAAVGEEEGFVSACDGREGAEGALRRQPQHRGAVGARSATPRHSARRREAVEAAAPRVAAVTAKLIAIVANLTTVEDPISTQHVVWRSVG